MKRENSKRPARHEDEADEEEKMDRFYALLRPARHEDEADEEEKMDRFYALLRRIRSAKDRLRANQSRECKKKKLIEGKSPWVPSFELEDFTQEIDFKNPVIFWSPSKKSQKVEKDQSLDLNLSL